MDFKARYFYLVATLVAITKLPDGTYNETAKQIAKEAIQELADTDHMIDEDE